MKINSLLIATFSCLGMSGALAQVEYDDMYFNKEDRAKLNEQRSAEVAYNSSTKKKFRVEEETENLNPSDSYSARNVNPEYVSRAYTEAAQADEADYFVNNYQYNRNQLNNWNNDFHNWYASPWYRNNFYGPMINNWNSPYYGYNSWNSPWFDPYWSFNGWSSSFSFFGGSRWNYGWGGNYNYWNRPYYGWDPYFGGLGYGGGFGYGGGYWNNYRYPGTIVVINPDGNNGRNVVYGKRPNRGTTIVSDRDYARPRTSVTNSVRNDNSGGRLATQGRKQEEYYNRGSRNAGSSTYDSRSNTEYNRSRSWDSWNNGNSGYDNNRSMNRSSSPSYSPSSGNSSGAGTRTNSGSGSGGRRGRD